jgi:hypothetical protein
MQATDLLTESDNQTICPVRAATAVAGALYHAAAAYGVYAGSVHIDIASLGQYMNHMMTLVGVGGGAIGAKSVMKGDAK